MSAQLIAALAPMRDLPEGGLAGFVARARELAAAYGERFEPSAWLVAKAESGEGF